MKQYSLTECYALLNVDPKTFRNWLAKDDITPKESKADGRIKYLSDEQVRYLASKHERSFTTIENTQEYDMSSSSDKLFSNKVSPRHRTLPTMYELALDHEEFRELVRELGESVLTLNLDIESLQKRLAKEVTTREALSKQVDSLIAQLTDAQATQQ